MPFSGIRDFNRDFAKRFRDIYYENVDKGRILPERKDLLKMSKIKKVASVSVITMVMTSCICEAETFKVSAAECTQLPTNAYTSVVRASTKKSKKRSWTSEYYGSNEVTGATEDDLNELIDKIIEHRGLEYCPFKSKGDVLKKIEEDYEISAIALMSIWTWESSFGTSTMAINRNNYGGIKGSNGYKYFDTIDEGMTEQGRLLHEVYVEKGYVTYSEIASKYCPGNMSWSSNISSTARQYAEWLEKIMD